MPKAKEREKIGISFLGGKYYIIHTDYGWTMRHFETKVKKDGDKEVVNIDRYYASLGQCCKEIVQREGGKCKTAEDVIKTLSSSKNLLEIWINDELEKMK